MFRFLVVLLLVQLSVCCQVNHMPPYAAFSGKTLNVTQQLTSTFPAEMVPIFLTFSARTSANQTQDIIDSRMDKRRKVHVPADTCSSDPTATGNASCHDCNLACRFADIVTHPCWLVCWYSHTWLSLLCRASLVLQLVRSMSSSLMI